MTRESESAGRALAVGADRPVPQPVPPPVSQPVPPPVPPPVPQPVPPPVGGRWPPCDEPEALAPRLLAAEVAGECDSDIALGYALLGGDGTAYLWDFEDPHMRILLLSGRVSHLERAIGAARQGGSEDLFTEYALWNYLGAADYVDWAPSLLVLAEAAGCRPPMEARIASARLYAAAGGEWPPPCCPTEASHAGAC